MENNMQGGAPMQNNMEQPVSPPMPPRPNPMPSEAPMPTIAPSPKTPEPLNKNLALICATIIGICLIVGGVVLFGGKAAAPVVNNNVSVQPQLAQTAVDIKNVKIAGEAFVGNANAPVVIAFWSDYQCPF